MASAAVTAELRCSICMEIYRDPVTLPCGHNFCRGCITQAWDHQEELREYKCPECQRIYRKRPELERNTTLHNICQAFYATETDQEQTGVFCNYCDFPVPATKSCLQCETSLCNHHLRTHDMLGGHTLLPPTTDLGKRKCSVHKKILEYYCTEDASCVCVSCYVIGEHVGHKMMSLDEASVEKKENLRNYLKKLMAETERAEKRVQSLEECRRKAQEKADGEAERVTALFRDLRRRLEELEKRVMSDITKQAQCYDDIIRQLEIKKAELSRKICHIEKLCNMTDPLTVLQEPHTSDLCDKGDEESDITRQAQCYDDVIRWLEIKKEELSRKMRHIEELCNMTDPLTLLQESDTGDLCDTEDRHDKQLHDGGDLDVAGISHTLHTGLADIMSGVTGGIYRQPADILLDVNTASNRLYISDDRKTASRSPEQNRPETPERFQDFQVLSTQSFSSGRHYWEVDVGGSCYWRVGMCYPSIARRGDQSEIGCNNKSWGLGRWYRYSVRHDRKWIQLPYWIHSDRFRIYLDYDAGQISFYALCDPIRHLHTYTATFTEPLHAVLWVGWDDCIKISGGIGEVRDPPTGDITGKGL